jgi:site-specific recombinase XerD
MERLSIKFYLNNAKRKGNQEKIYLRITVNRKKAELATKYFIDPKQWDEARQKAKTDNLINSHLSELESKVYKTQRRLEDDDRAVTAKIIKDIVAEINKFDVFILEFFEHFTAQKENDPELSKETGALYRQTFNKTKSFITEQYKTSDLHIKQLDFKFINEFGQYLISTGLVRNTVNKHHSRLRTVILQAIHEDLISKNPYEKFPLRKEKVERAVLSFDEIKKLRDHDLSEFPALERIRDKFLFCIYTGLRYGDAENLTKNHIVESEGVKYLYLEMHKTKDFVKIPLMKIPTELIDKYDNEERKITGFLFPRISNQKLNASLKSIADIVGINKRITHHTARRTFGTTILLESGADIKAVSKLLGHTDIKQTQIYLQPGDNYLNNVIKNAEEKLDH